MTLMDGWEAEPWSVETKAFVIEQPLGTGIIEVLTENGLWMLRARASISAGTFSSGDEINLDGTDSRIDRILGTLDPSALGHRAITDLTEVIATLIRKNPEAHLSFFRRAGPMSLKMHSFELLAGIGPSAALRMQDARSVHEWSTFEKIDSSSGIDSVQLLAGRYGEELLDIEIQPRLVDLLLRSS